MKTLLTIEKAANGYIVAVDGKKIICESDPISHGLQSLDFKIGEAQTILIETDPVFIDLQPDTVELCGLLWDTENLSIGGYEKDGRHYFTWTEAMEVADKQGKRLPTREEWEMLCGLGYTWEKDGRWFGGNHDTDHKGSLFFPAAGLRYSSNGCVNSVGTSGYYWSSAPNYGSPNNAGHLSFYSGNVFPFNSSSRSYGFSVRCVKK